ncbi:MAG TPA: hypothetical protein VIF40_21290 [Methylosinus sp.]
MTFFEILPFSNSTSVAMEPAQSRQIDFQRSGVADVTATSIL